MRILIVDDELHHLEDLRKELEFHKYDVHIASSSEQAKGIISEIELDYAIIDLILDPITRYDAIATYGGIEVIKHAKRIQPNLKCVIFSAKPFERVQEDLSKLSTDKNNEVINILNEMKSDYIYKGSGNYIEAVAKKIENKEIQYGEYQALILAVQNYQYDITNLKYPISDSDKLRLVLKNHYTFDERKITILKNPTRTAILDKLIILGKELAENDNLLIFYAGHGCWSDSRQQGYWLPSDASNNNPANWISNGDIRDYIRGIKTQHTLLISDACFSGAIFETRGKKSRAIQEKYNLKSRRAITSGDAAQTVPDRSIFLDSLISNLKSNQDKYLYAEKLYVRIYDSIISDYPSEQNPVYGRIQDCDDKAGGDFIFIKK